MNSIFASLLLSVSLVEINPTVPVVPKKQMHVSSIQKGAAVQMQTAKLSFVVAQPVTNYNTIAYYSGYNINGIGAVQMATNTKGPWIDVKSFLMTDRQVTNTFGYVEFNNTNRFYRLKWSSFTNLF